MRTAPAVERDRLDRADLVEREHRRADDRPARLDRELRHRECRARGTRARRSCASRSPAARGRPGRPGSCRRCRSRRRGRARASDAELVATPACSASTRRAATSKPEVSKIWEPMWECRPSRSRPGAACTRRRPRSASPVGDREAELLVLVRGGDVLVRVRLDAGGDPHHHAARPSPASSAISRQPLDLLERVDDDPPDAGLDRAPQLGDRLVVAVEADPGRVETGAQRDGQLAARADVEAEALLGDPARDRRCRGSLAGVVDVDAGEGVAERPGPAAGSRPRRGRTPGCRARRPGRRPAARRRPGHRRRPCGRWPTTAAGTSALASSGARSQAGPRSAPARVRAACFVGSSPHIRSGAQTPSRSRPLANTVRVAATSDEPGPLTGVTGSSPWGSTRQVS